MGHKNDDDRQDVSEHGSDDEFEYFDAIERQLIPEAWWRVRDYAEQRGYLFDQALEEGRGVVEEVESPETTLERVEVTQRFVAAL